jgi:multidrug efflux pump subunit AcrA (membrane-fusion protein)
MKNEDHPIGGRDELIQISIGFMREVKDMTPGAEMEKWLNEKYGEESQLYRDLARLIRVGVAEGWAANLEVNGPNYDWDEYIGHFEAPQSVELHARVTGQLTQVLFRDGQAVQEGQPLFVIDPQPYKAALDQARAAVEGAEATRKNAISIEARSAILVERNAVSREKLETDQMHVGTATAALHAAQAALETAELNYNWTTVRPLSPGVFRAVVFRSGTTSGREPPCSRRSSRSTRSGSFSTVPRASI